MEYFVIIPASGSGTRFRGKIPKQFVRFEGKELIVLTLEKFNSIGKINSILISTQKKFFGKIIRLVLEKKMNKVTKIVEGGKRRMDSVYNALMNINCRKNDFIIIHDAVRPFVSKSLIERLIKETKKFNAVIPGTPINDTVKRTSKKLIVRNTIPRENLFSIQTPQAFRYDILVKSFEKAYRENFTGTDEAAIVENAGYKIKLIEGDSVNIKVTTREDFKKNNRK